MSNRMYPLAKAQWESEKGTQDLIDHWNTSAHKVEAEAKVGALMASHVPAAKSVVDLGCSVGRYVPVCFEYLGALKRYTGYDQSFKAINIARGVYGDKAGVTFEVADIFDGAPYQKRSRPDILLSIDTSRHYKAPLGLLDTIVDLWPARYYVFSVLHGKRNEELLNGRVVTTAEMEAAIPTWGNVIAWEDMHQFETMSVRYLVIEGA